MANFPKEIADFMSKYEVSFDEVWKIPQGNAYAVKHKALERIAAEQNITYDRPAIVQSDLANKVVAVVVFASMNGRQEWATGEAAPYNNKNGYPLAMAEKRAKDRCILKLLQAHGAIYSEDEADDFKRENPHVTRPTDIVPDVEYDDNGMPVNNIPVGDERIERLPKAKAKAEYAVLQSELYKTASINELTAWGEKNKNRVESLPTDWQATLRGQFREHREELMSKQERAA